MIEQHHNKTVFDAKSLRPRHLESVRVLKTGEGRFVVCFCGQRVKRSIVPHLKKSHADEWNNWIAIFIEMRRHGLSLKAIMRWFRSANDQLLFSWTVIDRAIRSSVEGGKVHYTPPAIASVSNWEPRGFELESNTIWDFPIRGKWAVHVGDYRGNWPPQLVRNIILRYTQQGDLVLDTFMGGGTTLFEAWLLNRYSVGIDISKLAYQTATHRLAQMEELSKKDERAKIVPKYKPQLINADSTFITDATAYQTIKQRSVKLLCVHPPYLDALAYTDGRLDDLSQLKAPTQFLERIATFARGSTPYLASDNICAVLIGDVRKKGRIIPLGAMVLEVFMGLGFQLLDIIIKTQNRDRSSEFYYAANDGHLLAHEYLYILSWPSQETNET